jgi:hypothetical protein
MCWRSRQLFAQMSHNTTDSSDDPAPPAPPPPCSQPPISSVLPSLRIAINRRVLLQRFIIFSLIGAVSVVLLWLWVTSILLGIESNKNPAMPSSTPCAALNSSMMPSKYRMSLSLGRVWHGRMFVKPFDHLDIVAEQRCFANGVGAGSSLLWVNNQLAAFSIMHGEEDHTIYDCHGQRLYRICTNCWIEQKPKVKVYADDGSYILAADRPSFNKYQIAYGQPDELVIISLSSDNEFTIFNSQAPAADPRLLIMMFAHTYTTSPHSSSILFTRSLSFRFDSLAGTLKGPLCAADPGAGPVMMDAMYSLSLGEYLRFVLFSFYLFVRCYWLWF